MGKILLRSYDSAVEDAQRPFPKEEKASPRGKEAFQKGKAGKKHITTDSSATLVEDTPTPKGSKANPGASTPEGMPAGVRRALRRPQTVDMLNTSDRMNKAQALQRNLSREFAAAKEKQAEEAEAPAEDEGSSKKGAKANQISPEKTPATCTKPHVKAKPEAKANSKRKPETSNEPSPTRASKKPKPLPTEAEQEAYALKDHDTAASTSDTPTPPAEKKHNKNNGDHDSSPDKKNAKKDASEKGAGKKAKKDAGEQDANKKAKKDAAKQDADKKAKKDAGKQDADKKAKKDAGKQDADKKAKKDACEQDADKKAKDAGEQDADKKAKDAGSENQEESEDKCPSKAKKQAHKLYMRFYRNIHRHKLRLTSLSTVSLMRPSTELGRDTPTEIKTAFRNSKYCNLHSNLVICVNAALPLPIISCLLCVPRQGADVIALRRFSSDEGQLAELSCVQKHKEQHPRRQKRRPKVADTQSAAKHFWRQGGGGGNHSQEDG